MQTDEFVPVGEIERETGFSKDLLRKWRQRFGFPSLDVATGIHAGYSRETIRQLLLIRRLLEAGFRPSMVVGKSFLELDRLCRALAGDIPERPWSQTTQELIERLKKLDRAGLQASLAKERAKGTLTEFVVSTVAPLIRALGEAWSRMEIEVYHEHLCTSVIQRCLHAEILSCKPKRGFPTLLFATPPDEQHVLGLLMAEAVLAEHGANCLNFGSNAPLNDLRLAATACNADAVALSFSFAYPARNVRPVLVHLRKILPFPVAVWAGGEGSSKVLRPPKGVLIFSELDQAIGELLNLAQQTKSR
jgi:methanogenic corrinoid protein MtbC1